MIANFKSIIVKQPKIIKQLIIFGLDMFSCFFATWLTFCLRFDAWISFTDLVLGVSFASLLISTPLFIRNGLYRAIFRYTGWHVFFVMRNIIAIYSIVFFLIFTVVSIPDVPRSLGLIQPIIFFGLIILFRYFIHIFLRDFERNNSVSPESVFLILGAGKLGRTFARSLIVRADCRIVGFIDENTDLHDRSIDGIRIYSSSEIPKLFNSNKITDVVFVDYFLTRHARSELLEKFSQFSVRIRSILDLNYPDRVGLGLSHLQDIVVDDLLPREVVTPDSNLLHQSIEGQIVLITGAGGSIGSELARQTLLLGPKSLLLVDNNEHALYQIDFELNRLSSNLLKAPKVVPLLGSVCDISRMKKIFSSWNPNTIFHAAAFKHVTLVERNPLEAISTNILGTNICAQLAADYCANNFVLISSDKAVRPTNIMGATKRFSELIVQAKSDHYSRLNKKTIYSIVRFGNVLDSSGSVVPLFKKQIANREPLTVTHPDVTRFFMSIPEAAQLVIQASSIALGGEVFVLDMGKPIRISDLAKKMITLSGLTIKDSSNPNGDIKIIYSGLRPGEKLYEELLIGSDPIQTSHPKILKAREAFYDHKIIDTCISDFYKFIENYDINGALSVLKNHVQDFNPHSEILDFLYLQNNY